jgi:hypothetical protein
MTTKRLGRRSLADNRRPVPIYSQLWQASAGRSVVAHSRRGEIRPEGGKSSIDSIVRDGTRMAVRSILLLVK